jgi:hypothetical protein
VPQEVPLGGGRLAVYPGCVGGKGPGDVGADHWTLVELGSGAPRVRRVPAAVAPVWTREVDVGAFDDPAELEVHLRAWGTPDTWGRVRLTGAIGFDLDAAALRERAADAYAHLEVEDATSSIASRPARRLGGAADRPRRLRPPPARPLGGGADGRERALLTRALRHGLRALAEEP